PAGLRGRGRSTGRRRRVGRVLRHSATRGADRSLGVGAELGVARSPRARRAGRASGGPLPGRSDPPAAALGWIPPDPRRRRVLAGSRVPAPRPLPLHAGRRRADRVAGGTTLSLGGTR